VENLTLTGTANINGTGNSLANVLVGNAGINTLNGASGNDVLSGGSANDILTGGSNSDTFLFNTALATAGRDTVTDMVSGTDKISLDDAVFTDIGALGNFAAGDARFFAGAAAHDADDRIIYNQATGIVSYDADGNGAVAAVEIALLGTGATHPALAATDFLVS
jgi:serralysin